MAFRPRYKAPRANPVPRANDASRTRTDTVVMLAVTTLKDVASAVDTVWVVVAAVLVLFMQAGFLLLEVGFSRMKNAGTVVPKILANLSVASICYWAVGFALAFGGAGWFAGTHGTFLGTTDSNLFPAMSASDAVVPAKFFFQFVFCAVSLAIVWGTTLERIKFGAYLIYAVDVDVDKNGFTTTTGTKDV